MVAARLHLGTVLMALNQPTEAAAMLEVAHEQQPQDVGVLNELALSYTAQGSYDKALLLAQEAMRTRYSPRFTALDKSGAGTGAVKG